MAGYDSYIAILHSEIILVLKLIVRQFHSKKKFFYYLLRNSNVKMLA
jgi:hypothetical protein